MNAPVPESKKCPPFGKLKRKKCAACRNHLPLDQFDETKKTCKACLYGQRKRRAKAKKTLEEADRLRAQISVSQGPQLPCSSARPPPRHHRPPPSEGDKFCTSCMRHLPPDQFDGTTTKTCKACLQHKKRKRDKTKQARVEVVELRQIYNRMMESAGAAEGDLLPSRATPPTPPTEVYLPEPRSQDLESENIRTQTPGKVPSVLKRDGEGLKIQHVADNENLEVRARMEKAAKLPSRTTPSEPQGNTPMTLWEKRTTSPHPNPLDEEFVLQPPDPPATWHNDFPDWGNDYVIPDNFAPASPTGEGHQSSLNLRMQMDQVAPLPLSIPPAVLRREPSQPDELPPRRGTPADTAMALDEFMLFEEAEEPPVDTAMALDGPRANELFEEPTGDTAPGEEAFELDLNEEEEAHLRGLLGIDQK